MGSQGDYGCSYLNGPLLMTTNAWWTKNRFINHELPVNGINQSLKDVKVFNQSLIKIITVVLL